MQKTFPAVLSFLLPGLGQTYLQRFIAGVLFFTLFLGVQFTPSVRLYLPVLILLASFECFQKNTPVESSPRRNSLYAVIGFIGFLSWVLSYFPLVHSVGGQMQLNAQIPEVAKYIKDCQQKQGRDAVSLKDCVPASLTLDPWGNPLHFGLLTEGGFEIRSAGPDQNIQSDDDFVFSFR